MKNTFLIPLLLLITGIIAGNSDFVNPTGTYLLKGQVKNNKIIGHFGELRVRLVNTNTIVMCLYLNKGYPDYESGALMDTLHYNENLAAYSPPGDSSCKVYFAFDNESVKVFKALTDPHSSCGFHPGILIPAIFEKTSSDIPVIQDLSKRGSY